MALSRRSKKKSEPWTEVDNLAAQAMFAKDRYRTPPEESIDTTSLPHRKLHPNRDEAYKRWLRFQPCVIAGLIDSETGQPHVCWSPEEIGPRRYASDPMHAGKAYSGRLKRDDSGCMPGCRHAHRLQEDNMDRFDRRFGIDRHELAREHFARFKAEQERRER